MRKHYIFHEFEECFISFHVYVEVATKKNWYIGIKLHDRMYILAVVHIRKKCLMQQYTNVEDECTLRQVQLQTLYQQ